MIMRLIAFAYTYHYLNWFSKTSIIKWHKVSKNRIAAIAVVWLASLALYAYNYDTGMAVLYFISVLHVMLEFPLNHRTFAGIGRELYAMAK
jgi:cell division protein FtsW (lipid II flippase)